MPRHNWFELGSYNLVCDQCGLVFKAGEMQRRWDNAWVDAKCFEIRQPQDFVRGIPDNQSVPFARPRQLTSSAYLGFSGAGRAQFVSGVGLPFATYFEIITQVALTTWGFPLVPQYIYSQRNPMGLGNEFYVQDFSGLLVLRWTDPLLNTTTMTSTAAPTVTDGDALYLKATLTLTSATATAVFYTSTDGETYSQLGATVTAAGATGFYNPGPVFALGARPNTLVGLNGKLYSLEVNGAPGGSNRLLFDASDYAPNSEIIQVSGYQMQLFGDAAFALI